MLTPQEDAVLYRLACRLVERFFDGYRGQIRYLPATSQMYSFLAYARNYSPERVMDEFVRQQRLRAEKSGKASLRAWYGALEQDFRHGQLAKFVESQLSSASESMFRAENGPEQDRDKRKQLMARYYPIYARHIVSHYLYRLACFEMGLSGGEN
ncbi:MAG: hypothetical protein GX205_07725 [Firmicutes bacterium]|nr:hypothetical protein [Bacillota bacterium]